MVFISDNQLPDNTSSFYKAFTILSTMADNISSCHDYFTISLTDADHFSSSSSIDGFQFQKNSCRIALSGETLLRQAK
jgi:hypothetical protein